MRLFESLSRSQELGPRTVIAGARQRLDEFRPRVETARESLATARARAEGFDRQAAHDRLARARVDANERLGGAADVARRDGTVRSDGGRTVHEVTTVTDDGAERVITHESAATERTVVRDPDGTVSVREVDGDRTTTSTRQADGRVETLVEETSDAVRVALVTDDRTLVEQVDGDRLTLAEALPDGSTTTVEVDADAVRTTLRDPALGTVVSEVDDGGRERTVLREPTGTTLVDDGRGNLLIEQVDGVTAVAGGGDAALLRIEISGADGGVIIEDGDAIAVREAGGEARTIIDQAGQVVSDLDGGDPNDVQEQFAELAGRLAELSARDHDTKMAAIDELRTVDGGAQALLDLAPDRDETNEFIDRSVRTLLFDDERGLGLPEDGIDGLLDEAPTPDDLVDAGSDAVDAATDLLADAPKSERELLDDLQDAVGDPPTERDAAEAVGLEDEYDVGVGLIRDAADPKDNVLDAADAVGIGDEARAIDDFAESIPTEREIAERAYEQVEPTIEAIPTEEEVVDEATNFGAGALGQGAAAAEQVAAIGGAGLDVADDLLDQKVDEAQDFGDEAVDTGGDLVDQTTDALSDAADDVGEALDDAKDELEEDLDDTKEAAEDFIDGVTGFFG